MTARPLPLGILLTDFHRREFNPQQLAPLKVDLGNIEARAQICAGIAPARRTTESHDDKFVRLGHQGLSLACSYCFKQLYTTVRQDAVEDLFFVRILKTDVGPARQLPPRKDHQKDHAASPAGTLVRGLTPIGLETQTLRAQLRGG